MSRAYCIGMYWHVVSARTGMLHQHVPVCLICDMPGVLRWRCIQEKEHRHAYKYHAQHPVKPACLPASYIPYDELRVLGGKEPLPIQDCGKQGDDARYGEDTLNDVLAHKETDTAK